MTPWDAQRISTLGHLALFLHGPGDSFTGDLLRLIARADRHNRARLRKAFPREVRAWEVWMETFPAPTFGELAAAVGRVADPWGDDDVE